MTEANNVVLADEAHVNYAWVNGESLIIIQLEHPPTCMVRGTHGRLQKVVNRARPSRAIGRFVRYPGPVGHNVRSAKSRGFSSEIPDLN